MEGSGAPLLRQSISWFSKALDLGPAAAPPPQDAPINFPRHHATQTPPVAPASVPDLEAPDSVDALELDLDFGPIGGTPEPAFYKHTTQTHTPNVSRPNHDCQDIQGLRRNQAEPQQGQGPRIGPFLRPTNFDRGPAAHRPAAGPSNPLSAVSTPRPSPGPRPSSLLEALNRAASPSGTPGPGGRGVPASASARRYPWLLPAGRRDMQGRRPTDPLFDPNTCHISDGDLGRMTPFERQFWEIKRRMMGLVLFVRHGAFYNLFDIDSEVGLAVGLNQSGAVSVNMNKVGMHHEVFATWAARVLALGLSVGRVEECPGPAAGEAATAVKGKGKGKGPGGKGAQAQGAGSIIPRRLSRLYTPGTALDAVLGGAGSGGSGGGEDSMAASGGPLVLAVLEGNAGALGLCLASAPLLRLWVGWAQDGPARSALRALLGQQMGGLREVLAIRGNLRPPTMTAISRSRRARGALPDLAALALGDASGSRDISDALGLRVSGLGAGGGGGGQLSMTLVGSAAHGGGWESLVEDTADLHLPPSLASMPPIAAAALGLMLRHMAATACLPCAPRIDPLDDMGGAWTGSGPDAARTHGAAPADQDWNAYGAPPPGLEGPSGSAASFPSSFPPHVSLDLSTAEALNIVEGPDGSVASSLLALACQTASPPGRRAARRLLLRPPGDPAESRARLQLISALLASPQAVKAARSTLGKAGDWERLFPKACSVLARLCRQGLSPERERGGQGNGGGGVAYQQRNGMRAGGGFHEGLDEEEEDLQRDVPTVMPPPASWGGSLLSPLGSDQLALEGMEGEGAGGEGEGDGEGVARYTDLSQARLLPAYNLAECLGALASLSMDLEEALGGGGGGGNAPGGASQDEEFSSHPLQALGLAARAASDALDALRACFDPEGFSDATQDVRPPPGACPLYDEADRDVSAARAAIHQRFEALKKELVAGGGPGSAGRSLASVALVPTHGGDSVDSHWLVQVPKALRPNVPPSWILISEAGRGGGGQYSEPELESLGEDLAAALLNRKRALLDLLASAARTFFRHLPSLYALSHGAADLDVALGAAHVALAPGTRVSPSTTWCVPEFVSEAEVGGAAVLHIEGGWHPLCNADKAKTVIGGGGEAAAALGGFGLVPNDLYLGPSDRSGSNPTALVLTGGNMCGKSSFLRMAATSALLAHAGLLVPAARCTLTPVDRIFARMGAGDSLATGDSTFALEMQGASACLAGATRRSLCILDELGRGTSTVDGYAVCYAVLSTLTDPQGPRPRLLFATHFHQLSDEPTFQPPSLAAGRSIHIEPRVAFGHMAADVLPGGVFRPLYQMRPGPSPLGSCGVRVAAAAGLPREVLVRAEAASKQYASTGDPTACGGGVAGVMTRKKQRMDAAATKSMPVQPFVAQKELSDMEWRCLLFVRTLLGWGSDADLMQAGGWEGDLWECWQTANAGGTGAACGHGTVPSEPSGH